MAATNKQMVEALRGLLYDKGPEANGKASGIAAHIVAEHDMFGDSLTHVSLNREELATILAALRYYQNEGMGEPFNREDHIHEIATDGGDLTSLDDDGINELCERLNTGSN